MSREDDVVLPIPFSNSDSKALVSVWWTGVMLKKVSSKLFKQTKITEAQFNILRILKNLKGPFNQNQLSSMLLVDKSNITALIDKIEDAGFIERKKVKTDRRSYHIVLTKAGSKEADRLEVVYKDLVDEVMGGFSEEELQQLINLTIKIRKGVDASSFDLE